MREKEGPIKVAFVGTSCVGKTTLVESYRQGGIPRLAVVKEAARDYFTRNPQVKNRFSLAAQGNVQALALSNERQAHELGATRIVCDRSVLDAVAYVRSQGDFEGSRELLDRVKLWLPTYHYLYLLNPADIPYRPDNVRSEDEETRWGFHLAFIGMFEETGIPYELLSGSLDKRLRRVDKSLQL